MPPLGVEIIQPIQEFSQIQEFKTFERLACARVFALQQVCQYRSGPKIAVTYLFAMFCKTLASHGEAFCRESL